MNQPNYPEANRDPASTKLIPIAPKLLWQNYDGRPYDRQAFLQHVQTITWDKGWRPSFITLHNTGVPSLAQWVGAGHTPQERIRNLQAYYQKVERWHAGPHAFITPEAIFGFTDFDVPGVHASCFNKVALGLEMTIDADKEDFNSGLGAKVRDNAIYVLAVLHVALNIRPDGYDYGKRGLHFHRECVRDGHACPGKTVVKADVIKAVLDLMPTIQGFPHSSPSISTTPIPPHSPLNHDGTGTPPNPMPVSVAVADRVMPTGAAAANPFLSASQRPGSGVSKVEPSSLAQAPQSAQAAPSAPPHPDADFLEQPVSDTEAQHILDADAARVPALPHVTPGRCLGKKPAVHLDHVRPLSLFTAAMAPPLPAALVVVEWFKALGSNIGMMLNDQLGNCTICAVCHAIQSWTANAGVEVTIPDAMVQKLYEIWCGYNPADPQATDNGGVETAVLTKWVSQPVMDASGKQHGLAGFCSIAPRNDDEMKHSIMLLGCAYLGFNLPQSAQADTGNKWVVHAGYPAKATAPGSWGGHAVIAIGYDQWGIYVVSWGEIYHVNWWFVHLYCDEAYALFSHDQVNDLGIAPNGFDTAALSVYFEDLRLAA